MQPILEELGNLIIKMENSVSEYADSIEKIARQIYNQTITIY